jgi:hypothetical protein
MRPGEPISRMIDMAVTLLPLPDSPTSPSTLPCGMTNDTSSTALTTPASVKKWVRRFSTVISGGISSSQ